MALHQFAIDFEEARVALALFLRRLVELRGDLVPSARGRLGRRDQLMQGREPPLPHHDSHRHRGVVHAQQRLL